MPIHKTHDGDFYYTADPRLDGRAQQVTLSNIQAVTETPSVDVALGIALNLLVSFAKRAGGNGIVNLNIQMDPLDKSPHGKQRLTITGTLVRVTFSQ